MTKNPDINKFEVQIFIKGMSLNLTEITLYGGQTELILTPIPILGNPQRMSQHPETIN